MWTGSDLQELLSYRPDSRVLSVYLDLDPAKGPAEAQRLQLREILRPFEDQAAEDVEAVLRYFDQQQGGMGKGAAFFSCQSQGFFRAHSFAIPIRSRARYLDKPYVKPLAQLLDSHGHFGVALVDQQNARFFHLHLGTLAEEESWQGESVRHTKRGGGSQAPGRRGGTAGQTRYSEEIADRNLKEAAQRAGQFFKKHGVRRVILGGSEATLSFFEEVLPKAWQSLIIGNFAMDMNAGSNQVVEKTLDISRKAELEREQAMINHIITIASKGGEAVLALDETLEAVHAGRIRNLVLAEGFRQAGYQCQACGYLTIQPMDKCPFCGGTFREIEDAVEYAVRKVLEDGGEVEVINRASGLDEVGKIGGLLRY